MNIEPYWLLKIKRYPWDKRQKGWNLETKLKYLQEMDRDTTLNAMHMEGPGLTREAKEMIEKAADAVRGKRCPKCDSEYQISANGYAFCAVCIPYKDIMSDTVFRDDYEEGSWN